MNLANSTRGARAVRINTNPKGGVPKYQVFSAEVRESGVAGDKQRDRRFHGGPNRAVSLYSLERIESLRAEGHPITPGSCGENITVQGLDWDQLRIGDRLRVGSVRLELTGYANPCTKISASFVDGEFKRISHKVHPGWSRLYARVLTPGTVHEGDVVEVETGV